jgi:hypothetical protein
VKHDGSGSSGDTRWLAVVVKPLTVDVDLLAMDAEPRAAIGVDLVRSPASAVGITPAATVAFGRSGRGPHQRPRTGRKRETPCSSGKSSTRERTRCEEEEEEVSAAAAGIGLLPSPPEGESRLTSRKKEVAGGRPDTCRKFTRAGGGVFFLFPPVLAQSRGKNCGFNCGH